MDAAGAFNVERLEKRPAPATPSSCSSPARGQRARSATISPAGIARASAWAWPAQRLQGVGVAPQRLASGSGPRGRRRGEASWRRMKALTIPRAVRPVKARVSAVGAAEASASRCAGAGPGLGGAQERGADLRRRVAPAASAAATPPPVAMPPAAITGTRHARSAAAAARAVPIASAVVVEAAAVPAGLGALGDDGVGARGDGGLGLGRRRHRHPDLAALGSAAITSGDGQPEGEGHDGGRALDEQRELRLPVVVVEARLADVALEPRQRRRRTTAASSAGAAGGTNRLTPMTRSPQRVAISLAHARPPTCSPRPGSRARPASLTAHASATRRRAPPASGASTIGTARSRGSSTRRGYASRVAEEALFARRVQPRARHSTRCWTRSTSCCSRWC